MKIVTIQYYALLREQAGQSVEEIETTAIDIASLYEELSERHGFSLRPEQLRVAINDEFASFDHPVNAGDTVVFIPPVAGG